MKRQKMTCERCKALQISGSKDGKCTLGYKVQEYRPLEDCPKPLTKLQYLDCFGENSPENMDKN